MLEFSFLWKTRVRTDICFVAAVVALVLLCHLDFHKNAKWLSSPFISSEVSIHTATKQDILAFTVWYTQNLHIHPFWWIPTIYIKVDRTGGYYAKWNKSIRERQLSYDFTHMWNIRNSTEDCREKRGNWMGKKSEREINHERLFGKQTEGRWRGAEWGDGVNWVMGIKESTWWDEHQVLI